MTEDRHHVTHRTMFAIKNAPLYRRLTRGDERKKSRSRRTARRGEPQTRALPFSVSISPPVALLYTRWKNRGGKPRQQLDSVLVEYEAIGDARVNEPDHDGGADTDRREERAVRKVCQQQSDSRRRAIRPSRK